MTRLYHLYSIIILFCLLCPISLFSQSEDNADPLFTKYEWLEDQYSDCEDLVFEEYDLGAFSFIYGSDGRLFFQDGTFYCQDSETRDCRELYDLSNVTAMSNCPDKNLTKFFSINSTSQEPVNLGDTICLDIVLPQLDNVEYFQIPINFDSETLQYLADECMTSSAARGFSCNNVSYREQNSNIRILWFHPDAQSSDIPEGDLLSTLCFQVIKDSGNSTSVSFESNDGFNFEIGLEGPSFNSASDFQFQSASISIEKPKDDNPTGLPVDMYPWMNTLEIDCNNLLVTEFDQGAFSFFVFDNNNSSQVYFQDGTFFCQTRESLDCKVAYNLLEEQIANQWTCNTENMSSSLISGKVIDTRGNPLEDVSVRFENLDTGGFIVTSTSQDGSYSFDIDPNDNSSKVISITGSRQGNSCMNIFDVVKTRAFILGILQGTEFLGLLPASIFAMDFNENAENPNRRELLIDGVSTLDIVLMNKILLGLDNDSNLWRFYDASSVRKDGNAYEIDRRISISDDRDNYDFVGYQLGDLDNCKRQDFIFDKKLELIYSEDQSQSENSCYNIVTNSPLENINGLEFQFIYQHQYSNFDFITSPLPHLEANVIPINNEISWLKVLWTDSNIIPGFTLEAGESIATVCLDPMSDTSIPQTYGVDGIGVVNSNFEYIGIRGDTLEIPNNENSDDLSMLRDVYPWTVDIFDCMTNGSIVEYESGIFKFLYIKPNGTLYFQDGTFYCQDSQNQDCRSLYNLTSISNEWSCDMDNFTNPDLSYLSNQERDDLVIYPNPVSDFIYIQNKEVLLDVQIFDSTGKEVHSLFNINSPYGRIDFQEFHSGAYFIKVRTINETIIESIVKL